jgi:hypothetical protein
VRSGGQDLRDPFLKIEELVQNFLKSVPLKILKADVAEDRKAAKSFVVRREV